MLTISNITQSLVAEHPFIEELLHEGLINISALARFLQADIEKRMMKSVNVSAISQSLKRFPVNVNVISSKHKNQFVSLVDEITVRSKLIDYTFINSNTIINCHEELLKSISNKNVFYTYSKGVSETSIILSSILSEKIEEIFKNEVLLDKVDNLSSISLKLYKNSKQQVGLYYFILKKIAWKGINIIEVVSTMNEFTIIIEDKNVDATFSIIKKL